MRRSISRLIASTIVVMQLAAGSGTALPEGAPVIGQVILSSHASLRGSPLPGVGTLFENDVLQTEKGGRALVEFPRKMRAALAEGTKVQFRDAGGRLVANLDSGTIIVQRQDRESLLIDTPKYVVEPSGSARAIYMVARLPDQHTVVAARFGTIVITEKRSGQRYVLPEGRFASISASAVGVPATPGQEKEESRQAPDQPSGPASAPPPQPGWQIGSMSHGASVALVGALVAGGAAAAALPALGGDKSVSPTQ